MANHARILLFHVEPLKAAHIESLCEAFNIRVSRIKPAEYSQKLGYLAGMPGFLKDSPAYTGPEFPSEMMVFSSMDETLDQFLSQYREAGIPSIGLKAVITPHNISWSAADLYKELFIEHQSFQKK